MNNEVLIIKFGELHLKGQNKKVFIDKLITNIKDQLANLDHKVENKRDHLIVRGNDIDALVQKMKNVFGISIIYRAKIIESDIEIMKQEGKKALEDSGARTFRVTCSRKNKKFELNSIEICRAVAGHILATAEDGHYKVDLKNFEYNVKFEMQPHETYFYVERIEGAGGLPLGTSGKGCVLLSGGIDSPVAAYLAMRRGLKITLLNFESPPYTSAMAHEKVKELYNVLIKFDPKLELVYFDMHVIQEKLFYGLDQEYFMPLFRRKMYSLAARYAKENKAKVLLNGESLGQVASQTLESINVVDKDCDMLILRPLICFDKIDIIKIAKEIGTYEISIKPFEDACTVFMPKSPVIKPKLPYVLELEAKLDLTQEVEDAFNSIIKVDNKTDKINNII